LATTVAIMWLQYSALICTGCWQGNTSRSKSAYWSTKQSMAWHHGIWTRCAFQFPLFPTFPLSVLLLVVIWSDPEQGYNWATRHFVWLDWSPGTVYHWTFVRHVHYQRSKTCSRYICSHVPTSLTNCFQEYEQRTLYNALVMTLAMLLRLKNCRFIIIY